MVSSKNYLVETKDDGMKHHGMKNDGMKHFDMKKIYGIEHYGRKGYANDYQVWGGRAWCELATIGIMTK